MKTRGFIVIVFALTLALSAQFVNTSSASPGYSARLISPTAGQVLHPGQKIRVQWRSVLPDMDLESCESEVWLSLDGGISYYVNVSPWMDPKAQYVYWTVPNLPTNEAVMDIRFGCEYPHPYPESLAPQPQSMFVIAKP
jgi:hypothetical protein